MLTHYTSLESMNMMQGQDSLQIATYGLYDSDLWFHLPIPSSSSSFRVVLYAYSLMFCLTYMYQQNVYSTSDYPLHEPIYCEPTW